MTAVNTYHPEYAGRQIDWQMIRDCIDGPTRVKDQGILYLPAPDGFAAQPDGGVIMYDAYRKRGTFPDIVNPTSSGMVGMIHSKEAQIEMPKEMEGIWEKATRLGLTLESFHRLITSELLNLGRYGILVDAATDGSDLPFLSGYATETIINWDSYDRSFFVLDESRLERTDFTWTLRQYFRVIQRERSGRYTQTLYGPDLVAAPLIVTPTVEGNSPIEALPFVVGNAVELSPRPIDPPLAGVGRSALSIYRLDCDYRHQLFMSGQETLTVTGTNTPEDLPKFVGAGVVHGLPTGASMTYVGPSCKGIEAHRTAIIDERANAVFSGARLFDNMPKKAESGDALRLRFSAQTATLKTIALTSAAMLERALRFVAMFKRLDASKVIVRPNLDFIDTSLSGQEVINLVQGWQAGGFSYQTLYENLQRGGVASTERDWKAEQTLISKERQRATQEGQVSQDNLTQHPGVPPGNSVQTNGSQIRQGQGGQAGSGGGA